MSDFFLFLFTGRKIQQKKRLGIVENFVFDIPPELQVVSVEIKEVTVVIIKKEVCPYSYN